MLKFTLITLGCLCVVLALVGIFLPLLPTTPFLLLAAWCFARSSPRLYQRLLQNKWFGPTLLKYREQGVISIRAKILSLTTLWLLMGYSVLYLVPLLAVKVGLLALATWVAWFILTHPSQAE